MLCYRYVLTHLPRDFTIPLGEYVAEDDSKKVPAIWNTGDIIGDRDSNLAEKADLGTIRYPNFSRSFIPIRINHDTFLNTSRNISLNTSLNTPPKTSLNKSLNPLVLLTILTVMVTKSVLYAQPTISKITEEN